MQIQQSAPKKYRFVILGAGCAGLSLAWYLLEQGVSDPILLLDRRAEFTNDRTWCFWDTEPTPFSHLACAAWSEWGVYAGNRRIARSSPETPYLCLRGIDFYQAVLEKIARFPNVQILRGVSARRWEETGEGVRVCSDAGAFYGETLINACGSSMPVGTPNAEFNGDAAKRAPKSNGAAFHQIFTGHFVRSDRAAFDPSQATLMDWNVPQSPGALRFAYVLPFSSTRALVEITDFVEQNQPVPGGASEAIDRYLRARSNPSNLARFTVENTETGCLPMTTRYPPTRTGSRVFHVGIAGGAARPSSGYAFLRIQRTCRVLAAALAIGQAPPRLQIDPPRRRFLDRVFLQALRDYPERFPGIFADLFERVPSAVLVRFLSDQSGLLDDAHLIRALPLVPFARSACKAILG